MKVKIECPVCKQEVITDKVIFNTYDRMTVNEIATVIEELSSELVCRFKFLESSIGKMGEQRGVI